jgi:hypothetical protein
MTLRTADEGTSYCPLCEAYAREIEKLKIRLEAAELCARYLDSIDEDQLAPVEIEALKEWRKAAGK